MKPLILLTVLLSLAALTTGRAAEPKIIPLQVRENIRVVYQVSEDALHEGVDKGLFYARKLINTYEKQGIAAGEVHVHVVYHGTAIAAVVNPEARQRLKAATAENPNGVILAELVQRGVQIELCEDTMRKKGVVPAELMPGVKLIVGAYPRLIDLQLQGFAYIKFE